MALPNWDAWTSCLPLKGWCSPSAHNGDELEAYVAAVNVRLNGAYSTVEPGLPAQSANTATAVRAS